MQNIKTKISELFLKVKNWILSKLITFDAKFQTFMPNPKLRKISYITVTVLVGFMFLIIILGILISPFRNRPVSPGLILNKPNIKSTTPEPEVALSPTQQKLLKLETDIKNLVFPESILNIPVIEFDIKI